MNTPSMMPISVGVSDAAQLIGISRSRMYELVADGTVASTMIGGRRVVPVRVLHELVGTGDDATGAERAA